MLNGCRMNHEFEYFFSFTFYFSFTFSNAYVLLVYFFSFFIIFHVRFQLLLLFFFYSCNLLFLWHFMFFSLFSSHINSHLHNRYFESCGDQHSFVSLYLSVTTQTQHVIYTRKNHSHFFRILLLRRKFQSDSFFLRSIAP